VSSISTVTIGNGGSLAGIHGAVTIHNGPARDPVTIEDSNDSGNHSNVTISNAGVTGLAPAAINFTNFSVSSLTINGGTGNSAYTVTDTPVAIFGGMTLNTGPGTNAVNVQGTSAPLLVDTPSASQSSITTVTIGNAGSLAGIQGAVTVHNQPALDALTIDDSNDSGNHSNVTISSAGVTGLAPVAISFTSFSVSRLTINGGTGNCSYTVTDTPALGGITLNTGSGTNAVNVQGTSFRPLLVDTPSGSQSSTTVTIGNAGSLAGIHAAVTIHNGPARDPVTIDDSNDSSNHSNVTISSAGVTGLAPAEISFTNFSVSSLTINGGTGNSSYTVTDTRVAISGGMTLNTGLGGNIVRIEGTTAPLTVNTGSGDAVAITSTSNTLDPISAVTVIDPTGTSTVTVGDSGYGSSESYIVTNSTVTIGRSAAFSLTYGGIASLTLVGGPGSDVFAIDSTSVATRVIAGGGGNIFRISPVTQYLAGSILGSALTLDGGGGDTLEFFDGNDPASETLNFDAVPMN
jgi:hypothetical protein